MNSSASSQQITLFVIALPAAIGALLMAIRYVHQAFFLKINAEAFMSQIMKLVMANNKDRAIKLCSAAPNALLAVVTKRILVDSSDRYFDRNEAMEKASVTIATQSSRFMILNLLGFLGLAGTAYLWIQNGMPRHKAFYIPMGINAYLMLATFSGGRVLKGKTTMAVAQLLDLLARMGRDEEEEAQPARGSEKAAQSNQRPTEPRAPGSMNGEIGEPDGHGDLDVIFEDAVQTEEEEGGGGPNAQRDAKALFFSGTAPVTGSAGGGTPVVCTFCGAPKAVRSGWEGKITAYNIDDWVDGPCEGCGGELFSLKP